MRMPDVNVLVYAHRADEAAHVAYKTWLDNLINGEQPFALSVMVAVGFVRVVTNPRIYVAPTPLPLALAVVDELAAHPNCHLIAPGTDHLGRVLGLCRATDARGSAVADAQHAALAMAEGCTFVTRDSGFARFASSGLVWEHLVL